MEYLIYLGFFIFGWVLAALNFKAKIPYITKTVAEKVTEDAFKAGVQCGYQETLKQVGAQDSDREDTRPVGFSITPANMNKTNGDTND